MFTEKFGLFVCDGDTIKCTVEGFDCVAWTERDDNGDAPDERQDGFWPSLNPQDAGYIGPLSKRSFQRHTARAKAVMDAWKNDQWDYCGVCVAVHKNGVQLTGRYNNALWGVERNYPNSDNDYLQIVANELLPKALAEARGAIAKLVA